MYYSMALVAIQVLIRSVSSLNITNEYVNNKCYENQGKYKSGSLYDLQLKHTIRSAYNGNFANGFQHASGTNGSIHTSVNYQCRGDDTSKTKCRSCFQTAKRVLQRKCPKYKGGIIWFEQCLLEISSVNTMHKNDKDNKFCIPNSRNITGDPIAFEGVLAYLITRLKAEAKSGERKFYAAELRRFGKEKVYGMVECTNDLSSKTCNECVVHSVLKFQDCFRNKRGAKVFGRSCNLRFEIYPFFNTKVRS